MKYCDKYLAAGKKSELTAFDKLSCNFVTKFLDLNLLLSGETCQAYA